MDLGLNKMKAIITGGSRGIGLHTGALLASEGCDIAFCGRTPSDIKNATDQINAAGGGTAIGFQADLESEDATREFARSALAELNGVDILIHNASGFDMTGDEEGWMRTFQVDMMAGVRLVEECLGALKASEAASITFIGSMASKFHFGRPPSSYGAAKGAMRVYANDLAQHYGKDGIRANVISPGAVWFEGGAWDKRKKESPPFYAAVEKTIPLGRLGTADELARAITFVVSPAGLWINAEHIAVDGGQVAAVD
ncbi:MAG: SDR family oxidoreductase [Pseudomonadales bacterium]|nr:SDR family oxidoreductase [Pseudomonadales bacterium]